MKGLRAVFRIIAAHCIEPNLRIILYRLSGIKIGKKAVVNINVNFIDSYEKNMITIEDEVAIAPNTSFVTYSTPNNSHIKEFDVCKIGPILIKKGAWIGTGAVILPNVTVGQGAIIGANSVIRKNVEDYAIMAGNPVKKIGDVRNKPRITNS